MTTSQLLRSRLPPRKVSGGLLNLGAFRHMPYTLYSASAFFTFLGLFTGTFVDFIFGLPMSLNFLALTYIDVSATKIGISSDFSFYFVAFANASSLFGRFAGGLVSRRFGTVNHLSHLINLVNLRISFRIIQYHGSLHASCCHFDLCLAIC